MSQSGMAISAAGIQQLLRRSNVAVITGLAFAYIVSQVLNHGYGRQLGGTYGLVQLFDLRVEQNLPTAFSTLLLAIASLVIFVIAVQLRGSENERRWWILALVFLFLSFDEAALLHERWSFFIWNYVSTGGVLHDAWLIVYGPICVGLAIYFWPFVMRLPPDTRNRFIFSGAIYVAAALGMELVEGYYETYYGSWEDSRYAILAGFEEIGEMSGIAMFIDASLRHLRMGIGVASVRFH